MSERKMLVEELAIAAREIRRTTSGPPGIVAHFLCYWLDRCAPCEDPADVVRDMIADILDALEIPWDRAEAGWPDDEPMDEEDE